MEDKTEFSPEDLEKQIAALAGWRREGIALHRTFTFKNYREITAFLNHLVRTITEQNHHPDFALVNKTRSVPVTITTHSAGGLTRADIRFAQALNAWSPAA